MRRKIVIIILTLMYVLFVKVIRPYIYINFYSSKTICFISGVTPNFLGAILAHLAFGLIPNSSKAKSIIFTLSLVLFMEFERLLNQKIPFDIYDIVASCLGIIIIYILEKKSYV